MASKVRFDQIEAATPGGTVEIQSPVHYAGGIVQVVQTVIDKEYSYSGIGDFTDLTDFALTLTPHRATNLILVRCVLHFSIDGSTTCNFRWTRDNTPLVVGTSGASGQTSFRGCCPNTSWAENVAAEVLDAPSTVNPVTYRVQLRPYDSSRTVVINNSVTGGAGDDFRAVSTITAMEVAQ